MTGRLGSEFGGEYPTPEEVSAALASFGQGGDAAIDYVNSVHNQLDPPPSIGGGGVVTGDGIITAEGINRMQNDPNGPGVAL
jgi:hypothetical protein